MNQFLSTEATYGTFAPTIQFLPLRLITYLGLARGKITRLLIQIWLKSHGSYVDTEVRGLRYRLNLSDNVTDSKLFVSSKIYDKHELKALTKECQKLPFIDIGANTGYYSMQLAKSGCPQVLAIEPNPTALNRLVFNLSLNNICNCVTVIPKAVGPSSNHVFYQTDYLGSCSFVNPKRDASILEVQAVPLLQLLTEYNIKKIGGIKIDVEGYEDEVLLPFLESCPDTLLPSCIVIEACHRENWRVNLIEWLVNRGYSISRRTRSNLIFIL